MATASPLACKATARIALVNLDEFTVATFRECFSQFGIRVLPLSIASPEALVNEKFEACAIIVNETAAEFLDAIRTSPLNSRIVIYGVSGDAASARLFGKYGVNAALDFPVDRQALLRVARASRLLLMNEFRRYVRVPVSVSVTLSNGFQSCIARSQEISAGGMALRLNNSLPVLTPLVWLSFSLPGAPRVTATGQVCWSVPQESTIRVRFGNDRARYIVRDWIEDFLQIA